MLSSNPIPAGGAEEKAAYYTNLACDDYYQNGGEPPGRWIGRHAEQLGLSGVVGKEELLPGLRGFHPRTGEALAKNAGDKHHAGYDLTFSAPKSVSVVWAAADPEMRKAISEAQQRAVESAISHIEKSGALTTSRGHAWEHRVAYTQGVAAATYEHSTSREGDAQLHTHAIVLNVSPDGRRIDFNTSAKLAMGAAYRVALASEMQKLGFTVERDKTSFRVAGVSKDLEADQSKRRAQIVAELKERGLSGGKAAAIAALATRPAKGEVDREQMFAQIQLVAREHGLDAKEIERISGKAFAVEHEAKERAAAGLEAAEKTYGSDGIEKAARAAGLAAEAATRDPSAMPTHEELLREITDREAAVTDWQLRAAVMQEAQGKLTLEDAEKYLYELKASDLTIELRDKDGNTHYTSREMYETETRLVERVTAMHNEYTHAVSAEALAGAMAAKPTMSEQQKSALAHMTSPQRVAIVSGVAGAGKSYLCDAARDAWERAGYTVVGAALAGKAAVGLERSSAIESMTIARALIDIERGKITLDPKTVLVIDEAGMVGTRQMLRLQDHVDKSGAKLVIVGEVEQLPPIEAGSAMRAQKEALSAGMGGAQASFQLDEIRRQMSPEERKTGELLEHGEGAEERTMVMNARAGDYQQVVDHLEKYGRIDRFDTPEEITETMAQWVVRDLAAGHTSVSIREKNTDVNATNARAHQLAREAGLLTGPDVKVQTERGERQMATGDRLIFCAPSKHIGVVNGETGVVQSLSSNKIIVKMDGTGTVVTVPLSGKHEFRNFDHGYCGTTHKSQGDTLARCYYAPGGMAGRHLAYVGLSRHKGTGLEGVRVLLLKTMTNEQLVKLLSRPQDKTLIRDMQKVEKLDGKITAARAQAAEAQQRLEKLDERLENLRLAQTERLAAGKAEDPKIAAQIEKLEGQRDNAATDLERATRDAGRAQDKQNEIIAAREFVPEPPKTEVQAARADVFKADAAIERIERQIEAEKYNALEKQVQQNTDLLTQKEQQNGSEHPRNDRYADVDHERLAAGRSAAVRVGHGAEHAPGQPAESLDAVRNLSGIAVVHDAPEQQRAGHEMSVQADERYNLAGRQPAGDELRRTGSRDREADRGIGENLSTDPQAAARIERLEKQLAAAVAGREAAAGKLEHVAGQAAKAWAQQRADKAAAQAEQSRKAEISRLTVAPKLERNVVQRDGELARRALESHRAGDKLSREKINKMIDRGELKPTKDSSERLYFVEQKTGKVFAAELLKDQKRSTTSVNLQHLGLTSTKYTLVDKRVLGIKVGTTVLKSGGSLGREAAGRARDELRSVTSAPGTAKSAARALEAAGKIATGRGTARDVSVGVKEGAKATWGAAKTAVRVATKPVDVLLKKGEKWQKAGVVESVGARVQIAVENRLAERRVVKEMEGKVVAADKAKAAERAPAKVPEKAKERAGAKENARETPSAERLAEKAKELADRQPEGRTAQAEKGADRSPSTPEAPAELEARAAELADRAPEPRVPEKTMERGRELERGR